MLQTTDLVRFTLRVGRLVLAVGLWLAVMADGTAADNLLGLPTRAIENEGTLIIVGGGNLPAAADREFYARAGGTDAHIVLIPSAYPFSSREHMEAVYAAWSQEDVASFTFVDAKSREEADTDEFVAPLRRATGVWIGGGMQGRLSDLYVGTRVEQAIKDVLRRGGVVGGTSAGAAILSHTMIRHGTAAEAVVDRGLGLLEHAVVDQHFTERRREPRLLSVLSKHGPLIGFGIDEATALIVSGNGVRVVGAGRVTVCVSTERGQVAWSRQLSAGDKAEFLRRDPDEHTIASVSLEISSSGTP